jgi:SAM-dependent methyltransferase
VSDDLVAFYEAGYRTADAAEAARYGAWRAHSARLKAVHAATLMRRVGVRPHTLVEIGCGDGSLLAELAARGVPVLDGFELSAPAADIARRRAIPGARRIEAYDGAHVPAADGAYDLAVLSHVLEHVPDPPALLAEAARVAHGVLVEVPLEANRSAARPPKRAQARAIGHIQAFDRAAMHGLLREAGLDLRAELTDPLPYSVHAFFADGAAAHARAGAKWALRAGVWRVAPCRAERLFTVHWAGLAERA